MSLPLETLKELRQLSKLDEVFVLIDPYFEAIKNNVTADHCLTKADWEAMEMTWGRRKLADTSSFVAPTACRIQVSKHAALDRSLLQRGALVKLTMGWLVG